MCSASRPERGGEREDRVKGKVMTRVSAGWMTLAFTAMAVMISDDQEKWVKIGDLTSEAIYGEASPNHQSPVLCAFEQVEPCLEACRRR